MRTATRTRLALALVASFGLPAAATEPEHFGARLPSDPAQAPLSKAVLAGETLYLSGELGLLPGRKVPATAEEEARLVLTNVKATLALAGMTMDDLVSVQVFCSDVSHFDAWNAVYRTFFSKAFPARAFVGSGPLLFGARFEMQGVAVRRAPPPGPGAGDAAGGVVTRAEGVVPSAGLDGVYARLSAAYRALDAEAASAVYTEDVSYLPPGSPVLDGRAEARGSFAAFFESLRKEGRSAEISFEVLSRGTSADLGWDVGIFTLRTAKEGTEPSTMRGKFVVVARRGADGTWRWQVDAYNDLGRPKAP